MVSKSKNNSSFTLTGEQEKELGGSALLSNENKSQMSMNTHRHDPLLAFEGGTSELDN